MIFHSVSVGLFFSMWPCNEPVKAGLEAAADPHDLELKTQKVLKKMVGWKLKEVQNLLGESHI